MKQYENRKFLFIGLVSLIGLLYISRLFYIQIIDDSYIIDAKNQALRKLTDYPVRGHILDRNKKLLVFNEAAYDLMVVPRRVKADMDTMELCALVGIEKENLIKKLKRARAISSRKPYLFAKQISAKTYARLQEKLYKFNGFYVQSRTLRKYPEKTAAHLLGYIGEVSKGIVSKKPYYRDGDYIGISGVERAYEKELRGVKGSKTVLVDVHNREKGSLEGGKYDTVAVPGLTLLSTIDAELQKYGEMLMANKMGSVVALEPSTGEILALVTSPSYDPNLLVGRDRSRNYGILARDTLKMPLFNRALMAFYPPGSTFKLINALIGLQEGVLRPGTYYPCASGYPVLNGRPGCHSHESPLNLKQSIQHSCNSYYAYTYRSIIDNPKYSSVSEGYKRWRAHVLSFGIGTMIHTDLPQELKGLVPTVDYYNRYFGKDKWKSSTVVSLAIGQGELGVTPMQLANITATIANRGYYKVPHVVKQIGNQKYSNEHFTKKNYTTVDPKHFKTVIEGMEEVVNAGTARIAKFEGTTLCGKTGTAENPHGKDHSLFVAFAPKENPKIAISVMVENAGYGSTWAAPIASLMIERYLNDSTSRQELEKRMFEGNLIEK